MLRGTGASCLRRASRQQAPAPVPDTAFIVLGPTALWARSLSLPGQEDPPPLSLPEATREEIGSPQGSGLTFIFQLVLFVGGIDLVDVELRGAGAQRVWSVLVPRDGSCGQAGTDLWWHCLPALRRGQEFAVPPPPPHMLRPCRDTTTCPVSLTIFSRRLPLASCAPLPACLAPSLHIAAILRRVAGNVTAGRPSARGCSRAAESERGKRGKKRGAHSPQGLSLPRDSGSPCLPAPLPQQPGLLPSQGFAVPHGLCQGRAERGLAGIPGGAAPPKHGSHGLQDACRGLRTKPRGEHRWGGLPPQQGRRIAPCLSRGPSRLLAQRGLALRHLLPSGLRALS